MNALLQNIHLFLQIINIIGKWMFMVIKHYRVTVGILFFINLISFISAPEQRHFPWFTFLLTSYFVILFLKKRKQSEDNKPYPSQLHIENTNYIHIQTNEKSIINVNEKNKNHH